jgi:hypothetical protein
VSALILALATLPASAAPTSVDKTISDERLEASYNSGDKFVRYPGLDAYLAKVVRRLQDANPEAAAVPIRIHALNDELPYAFVLGNGACYVSTGLIARLDTESQLAAMIAQPLAAWVHHDSDKLSATERQRAQRNLVPDILLITLTAGFGAPAIVKGNNQARADEQSKLEAQSDAVAMQWLGNAGYDPNAAPAALRALQDRLSAEQRSGSNDLSDPIRLSARAEAQDRALGELSVTATDKGVVDPSGIFGKLAVFYALRLATTDVDSHSSSVLPILDRLDAQHGPTGYNDFLRAELIRRNSADAASVPTAIAAYERCVVHADAPPAAYRELAFLYRRAGNAERARQNFTVYLAHAPNANDAPIIRSYLENP